MLFSYSGIVIVVKDQISNRYCQDCVFFKAATQRKQRHSSPLRPMHVKLICFSRMDGKAHLYIPVSGHHTKYYSSTINPCTEYVYPHVGTYISAQIAYTNIDQSYSFSY